ncbi:DUF4244 domain-containing protein [Streptomyces sp. SID4937]|uniref:DUF4244 domain-containing protein n=2 Tax=Streptomyces TaxID=1883 RepID=UPI000B85E527|nr:MULTISPECIES: DUF4244 domain-containing protein [unclassified Streptomyces]MYR94976.1 DUF4244 domain-containing protein [Streptomyces sp. SID4937]
MAQEGGVVGELRRRRLPKWVPSRSATWFARWSGRPGRSSDCGMTTSEYAVGTIAACAFAAVLYKVVNSGPVMSAMQSMIESALDAKF